jgi:alkyl hydroperoxide reductase subunit AhpC
LGEVSGRGFFPAVTGFSSQGRGGKKYGVYLEDKGITDRATVIVDKQGVVRYAASVTPAGERNPKDLLAECQKINKG